MDWLKDNYAILLDNPFIRAGIIIIGSIVIAKVTDWIFVGFFRRWSSKTKTNLDDSIVNFLHKPIFYSILFFGFSTGVNLLGLPEFLNFAILGIFKTVTILIWLSLFVKVFTMSMEWTTKRTDNKILQSRTLPLFNNLGKIGIGLFGTYFIFLSWNININGILASAGVLGVVTVGTVVVVFPLLPTVVLTLDVVLVDDIFKVPSEVPAMAGVPLTSDPLE